MTPTHKPQDGDRAPISSGGAELETVAWRWRLDAAKRWCLSSSRIDVVEDDEMEVQPLVRRTDATALLAEKAQRIERLEAALCDILAAHANDTTRPKAFYIASAALSQPHPHGG